MEKGIIKNVSIEDFKTNENFVNYVDDDFMVINSLENVPYSNGTVRLNCFSDFLFGRQHSVGYE